MKFIWLALFHTFVVWNCMISIFGVWNCKISIFGSWRSTRMVCVCLRQFSWHKKHHEHRFVFLLFKQKYLYCLYYDKDKHLMTSSYSERDKELNCWNLKLWRKHRYFAYADANSFHTTRPKGVMWFVTGFRNNTALFDLYLT